MIIRIKILLILINGTKENPKRAARSCQRPAGKLFSRTSGRRLVPLAGYHNGTIGKSILRRRFLLEYTFSDGLPVQAAEDQLRNKNLPPEHQLKRSNLSGYFEGLVVSCFNDFEGVAEYIVAADRREPRRPVGAGDRAHL